MVVAEAIQRVQSLYSRGVQSDDSRLTPRHTYSALMSARSTLLRQRSDKNQKISDWSYQTLPCIELEKAPIHECPCAPSEGCMVLRSKHKIPKPITNLDSHLIRSITSLDGTTNFDATIFEHEKYSKGNKFTANKPGYYPRNGRIYITVYKTMKAVTGRGLFDDFIDAYFFPSICGECEGCECIDVMDIEVPIDGDLIRPLVKLANEELIIIMKQLGEDKLGNSSEDASSTGMIHQPQQQQG